MSFFFSYSQLKEIKCARRNRLSKCDWRPSKSIESARENEAKKLWKYLEAFWPLKFVVLLRKEDKRWWKTVIFQRRLMIAYRVKRTMKTKTGKLKNCRAFLLFPTKITWVTVLFSCGFILPPKNFRRSRCGNANGIFSPSLINIQIMRDFLAVN